MNTKLILTMLIWCCLPPALYAQEEKPELTLTISYVATANKIPYLQLQTQARKEKTIEIVSGIPVKVYLDEESERGFIGQVTTNDKGIAKLVLPPSAKETWTGSPKHTFIATTEETKSFLPGSSEREVTKGRILIDTLLEDGIRNITASFQEFTGSEWLPANEVEIKIGIRRQGGILPISDEESYTTDSTGMVTAEFKRDSLPGDKKGHLVIVARTEDHDLYGSVVAEKTLPWGVIMNTRNEQFGKRSLWATGNKVPLWLLLLAFSVVAGVWSVIVYLVAKIAQLRKLGRSKDQEHKIDLPGVTRTHNLREMNQDALK